MFKVIAEPNGRIVQTKKGNFIRNFLVLMPEGSKKEMTVHANKLEVLEGVGEMELEVRPPEFFFFAVEGKTMTEYMVIPVTDNAVFNYFFSLHVCWGLLYMVPAMLFRIVGRS